MTRLPFVRFCTDVLRIALTVPQRALLRVSVDGAQPKDLRGAERRAARELFGDVTDFDARLRRILVWRLGRDSGKSTLAAALAIWSAWGCDLSRVGRGHLPVSFVVAPTRQLARIGVGIARGLLVGPLEAAVIGETRHGFLLRRPDGRTAEVATVAAARGGANLRGRPICSLLLDEAEFFGTTDSGAAVNDREQLGAALPRLIEHACFCSTPWPSPNFMAELFDRNHGHPIDAISAVGASMLMRPSDQLAQDIADETERDEENADREYRCVPGASGGSRVFDPEAVDASVVDGRPLVVMAASGVRVGAGGDLALERDSSAIAIVSRTSDDVYELLEIDEVRPSKSSPLVPEYVIRGRFAPVLERHGIKALALDQHYRQSAKEHLDAMGLRLVEAPDTNEFKYDSYMALRAVVRSGKLRIPKNQRLVAQLKAVQTKPLDGGRTKIVSPRRAGGGHGDLVSAVVLACWQAHSRRVEMSAEEYARRTEIGRQNAAAAFRHHQELMADRRYGYDRGDRGGRGGGLY